MMILRLFFACVLMFGSAQAATISVTQGSGTNMLTKQDGSGNNASSVTICDAATPTTCAPVSGTAGIKIDLSTAFGTAGSANANVLSIQGIAAMTPILVTPSALPANQSVNVAQINGVTPLMGNGVTGTGSQRITIASDNTAFAIKDATGANFASVVTAINTNAITGFATNGCAGATVANTANKPFSNAGSATALLLVSGVSSQKVHVCGVNIGPVAGAVNVAMVEGTTVSTACDTGTAGMMGGATAATGWQFAANGGLTNGSGMGQVAITATNADNVCLLFSAGVQVSGVITYAIF